MVTFKEKKYKEFIDKAIQIHGDKYDYSKVYFTNVRAHITITCPVHGDFRQTPYHHINRGQGCVKCSYISRGNNLVKTLKYYLENYPSFRNTKYAVVESSYINSTSPLTFVCPEHGYFKQYISHFKNGSTCPKCGIARRTLNRTQTLDRFIERSRAKHGDKYDYSKVLYHGTDNPVTIICPIHGEFRQYPKNHYNGAGCVKCNDEASRNRQQHSVEDFIAKAIKIHGYEYDYSKVIYINNKIPVEVICKKHGAFKVRPDNHLYGLAGCGICNESKGENKIRNFLEKENIKYIREYAIPGHRYRYDFYLPELNILIEYDGQLHYVAVKNFGGLEHLLLTQKRDKEKNILAKNNSIPLIRIHYRMFNVLEDNLLHHISKIYKYRAESIYYKNFLDLCNGLKLPLATTVKEAKKWLTYNHTRSLT